MNTHSLVASCRTDYLPARLSRFLHLGYREYAPLLLRLVMGYGFMEHGWAKLAHGPANFERLLEQIGAPLPHLTSWVVPSVEVLGGAAILLGASVSLVAMPLIGVMLVAIFTVHIRYGFSSIKTIGLTPAGPVFGPPGVEVALLYIAGLVALILGGAGALSVESLIRHFRKTPISPPLGAARSGGSMR